MRDWIPVGKQTPQEAVIVEKTKRGGARGLVVDFIPGPDHVKQPPSGRQDQAADAVARAMRAQATAARVEYEEAIKNLQRMTVSQAVEFIIQAPFAVQEMYLAAEKSHGNRKSLLDRFPEVDPAVIEKFENIGKDDAIAEDAPASDVTV